MKNSHSLTRKLDRAKERISKLNNEYEDEISEGAKWGHPNCSQERQRYVKQRLRFEDDRMRNFNTDLMGIPEEEKEDNIKRNKGWEVLRIKKKDVSSWALSVIKINLYLNTLQWKCITLKTQIFK